MAASNRDGVNNRVLIPFRVYRAGQLHDDTKPSTSFDPIRVHQMKRKPGRKPIGVLSKKVHSLLSMAYGVLLYYVSNNVRRCQLCVISSLVGPTWKRLTQMPFRNSLLLKGGNVQMVEFQFSKMNNDFDWVITKSLPIYLWSSV